MLRMAIQYFWNAVRFLPHNGSEGGGFAPGSRAKNDAIELHTKLNQECSYSDLKDANCQFGRIDPSISTESATPPFCKTVCEMDPW